MPFIVFLLFLTLMIALWISCVIYRFAFYSPNIGVKNPYAVPPGGQYEPVADQMLENIARVDALDFEQVYITSFDGLHLAARFYRLFDRGPVQILFHGYRGSALREFGNCYAIAQKFGFNVLLVDQRGHGKSEGHTITFGVRERHDCKAWAWYVHNRFGKDIPIILTGVSMGAATVLMASDLDLPPNVRGIWADCPYSSPKEILRAVCARMRLPVQTAYPLALFGALIYGHFCIWRSSAVKSVVRSKVPVLLVHGEEDKLVPNSMSRRIYEACGSDKMLLSVKGAGHGLSYLIDPQKYEEVLDQFFRKCGLL